MNVEDLIDDVEANVGLMADENDPEGRADLERIIGEDLDDIRMMLGHSTAVKCRSCGIPMITCADCGVAFCPVCEEGVH